MSKKFMLAFASAALFVASAAERHSLTLFQDSVVNGTELKAGEYRLDVDNDKAVISRGKMKVESAIKVETADSKFGSTAVRYINGEGKMKVQEIRIGGTNRKLVFGPAVNGL